MLRPLATYRLFCMVRPPFVPVMIAIPTARRNRRLARRHVGNRLRDTHEAQPRGTITRSAFEYSAMGTNDSTPPTDEADKLPRHTTPTWEVELLISGVAVFAMLQLPGWLNEHMLMLLPRLGIDLRQPMLALFVYANAAAVILAVTFAAHLLLRAQWIARVGMHSVYPDGVRWDNLRSGPIVGAVLRKLSRDPQAAIERADNRATTVFAVGVSLASTLIVLTIAIVLLFPLVYGLARLFTTHVEGALVFDVIVIGLIAPSVILMALDRTIGARLSANGRLHRMMSLLLSGYAIAGIGKGGTTMTLLSSHHGERRTQITVAFVSIACVLLATVGLFASRFATSIGSYGLFPAFASGDAHALDSAHYDDQRDPLHDSPVAYVQSDVIAGDYLRLVVPYRPEADIPAQRQRCAGALAIGDEQARATSMLQCLGGLHAVTLDGKPLADPRYAAGSDSRTQRPALIAMIDVRALAPGRHELAVARPQRPGSMDDPAVDVIAFWR
jgi:hypothetical protein